MLMPSFASWISLGFPLGRIRTELPLAVLCSTEPLAMDG